MIKKILPHINLIVSLIMLVLFITHKINPGLGVLKGKVFSSFLFIYILLCLSSSLAFISSGHRDKH